MDRHSPLRRAALTTASLLAVGVTVAACGAGPSVPAAATHSSGSSAGSTGSTGSTGGVTKMVAYSSCMRSHGVRNFPDPGAGGAIPKEAVIAASRAVSTSVMQAAEQACAHLLPAGGSLSGRAVHPVTPEDRQDYLEAAACMRAHGITDFPDPVFTGTGVEIPGLDHLDTGSAAFTHASDICKKLIPPGLPYSSSS